jgi:hypothetical protein
MIERVMQVRHAVGITEIEFAAEPRQLELNVCVKRRGLVFCLTALLTDLSGLQLGF